MSSLEVTSLTEIANIIVLARLTQEMLPRYEADDVPLTEQQLKAIKRLEPQGRLVSSENLIA